MKHKNRMGLVVHRFVVGWGLVVAVIACPLGRALDAPAPNALQSVQSATRNGLSVSIEPWFEPARTLSQFGMDARARNILAVRVCVEQSGTGQTYLVQKSNIQLAAPGETDSEAGGSAAFDGRTRKGKVLSYVGVAVMSLPLIIWGAKATVEASATRLKFSTNELGDQTLAPGESAEGFTYFQIHENQKVAAGSRLTVALIDTASLQREEFVFVIPHEI